MSSDPEQHEITRRVLASLEACTDPRVAEISAAAVRHLHQFVLETKPSVAEWYAAIEFLTQIGAMCSADRQEFVLLSDTLGVSMLVDALNHPSGGGSTEHTVLGPFYRGESPRSPNGADVAEGAAGTPLLFEGTVTDGEGAPVPGALVEVWQADDDGFYDAQLGPDRRLRASFDATGDGRFWFWSIVPSGYPVPADGPVGAMLAAQGRHPFRPAHVHFRISAPGYEVLVTHVFVAGDKYLDSDVVFSVKESLIRELVFEESAQAPDGREFTTQWARLSYDFALHPLAE